MFFYFIQVLSVVGALINTMHGKAKANVVVLRCLEKRRKGEKEKRDAIPARKSVHFAQVNTLVGPIYHISHQMCLEFREIIDVNSQLVLFYWNNLVNYTLVMGAMFLCAGCFIIHDTSYISI